MNKLSELSYADIQSNIKDIPSKDIQKALTEAFNEAVHQAYEPIYFTAAIAAMLIIIFNKQFKNDALQEYNQNND